MHDLESLRERIACAAFEDVLGKFQAQKKREHVLIHSQSFIANDEIEGPR